MLLSKRRLVVVKEDSDDRVSFNLFVHHESENTHLGSTSVVQLDGTLLELGLGSEVVPAEVEGSITEVTFELSSSSDILHDEKLEDSNEKDHLSESSCGDGIRARDSGKAIWVVREGIAGKVNVSRQVESGTGDDLSKEGKHTNAAVLELNVTKAFELGLVTVSDKTERVVEAKRFLSTKFSLESTKGRNLVGLLRWSESSGRGDEGGKDSELHFAR
jgi:hypothetical protein